MKVATLFFIVMMAICVSLATAKTFQPIEGNNLEVKSGKCELCKFIVSEVQSQLKKHPVNVQGIVDKVCNIFPASTKSVCDSMLTQVVNNVIALLEDGQTVDKICELIKVCDKTAFLGKLSAEQATKLFLSLNTNFNSNGTCAMCKMIIQKAEDLIHDNEDNVEKKLLEVCKLLPDNSLEQMCDTIVVLYGPQIIDYILTHGDPDKLCHTIGLCKDKTPAPKPAPVEAKNGGCALCTYVVGVVEDYIKDENTQKRIEEALDKVCDLIPGGLKDQCKALVSTYEPQLIEFLIQKYPPKQICTMIGVCEKAAAPKPAPVEAKNGGCALCTYVVGVVEDYIKDDATQKKIEEALDKVCDLLPGGFKDQCKAFVSTYEPQLIELLTKKYTPKQVCTMIGVCEKAPQTPRVAKLAKSDQTCGLCKLVVGYVEQFVEEKKSEDQIVKMLEKVCNFLPGDFSSQCDALVETYLPQIIHMVVSKYPADKICQMIHLCEKNDALASRLASLLAH